MNLRQPVRWALVLLLLTVGVRLGAYLLRSVLLYPHLKRAAITFFEDDLDLQLELGAIRGSLLGGIEFDDVRISTRPSADTPLDISIDALRARYRLMDLLQGVDTFLGETTVVIDHPRALIDLSRPPSETPSGDGPEASGGWPAVLPRIAVLAGALDLKGDGYRSRFSGIRLDSSDREDAAAGFQLRIEDWRWHLPPLRDGRVKAGAVLNPATPLAALVNNDRVDEVLPRVI